MGPPSPPVALKDHCSIIYNNVLYVYSPDAFQTLPLEPNTQWSQETNGVSVTGATCVQGGVDGDNSKPALYVVGGATNSSSGDYPGLQRYSILDKSWTTITPVVPVTQNRLRHGTAYMNASSAIVVYAGSQNSAYTGPSTETFLIEMYPPYRVQAYSSTAPPVISPTMLTWSDDHALMVGGATSNQHVYTFGPAEGWLDLGLSLPAPLPDISVAKSALISLDDSSKILETFDLGQTPVSITRYVLLNPGGLPAEFGETAGNPTSSSAQPSATATGQRRRSVFLDNFPTYSGTDAPTTVRNGFSLAQGDSGLITILGGDQADSIVLFNGTGNTWLNANQVLSANPQATSTSPTSTAGTSSLPTGSTPSQTATTSSSSNKTPGLTVLGAVLGAICGAAAILIIALLWLRSVRRRRAHGERARRRSEYPADNKRASGGHSFEEQGLQPLSKAGQPMGRSPVPSTFVDPNAMAIHNNGPDNWPMEKPQEKRPASAQGNTRQKPEPHVGNGMGFGQGMFKREKSPLSISRPFAPDLGDYKNRPSIDLGHATPAAAAALPKAVPVRNFSQRKTDEGWAKYFQADNGARIKENRATYTSQSSASTSKGRSGFWPGAGVSEGPLRSPKNALRDSSGNALHAQTVAAQSPSLENGPAHARARGVEVVQGIPARISSGESVTSDGSSHDRDDDDGYEEEKFDHAYSSGIPSSIPDLAWIPVGNTWSGPTQRPLRPPSSNLSSAYPSGVLPLPTSTSHDTSNSSGTKTSRSSIPSFPMPNSTIRPVGNQGSSQASIEQHSAVGHLATTTGQAPAPLRPPRPAEDVRSYFDPGPGRDGMPTNNNLSWLNLNAEPR